MPTKKDNKAVPASKPAGDKKKQPKKKWGKGKQTEKIDNMVLFNKTTYDKLESEVAKYKLVTPSVLSSRLGINVALARKAIDELMHKGLMREVSSHASQQICTRATNVY